MNIYICSYSTTSYAIRKIPMNNCRYESDPWVGKFPNKMRVSEHQQFQQHTLGVIQKRTEKRHAHQAVQNRRLQRSSRIKHEQKGMDYEQTGPLGLMGTMQTVRTRPVRGHKPYSTQYRICTFRHPKDLEVVPHPKSLDIVLVTKRV